MDSRQALLQSLGKDKMEGTESFNVSYVIDFETNRGDGSLQTAYQISPFLTMPFVFFECLTSFVAFRPIPFHSFLPRAALRDICEQNGITEDQLVNTPDTITSIEMFLFNYPKASRSFSSRNS